jgi:hypothetical protein
MPEVVGIGKYDYLVRHRVVNDGSRLCVGEGIGGGGVI